ncbi:MAG TPA: SgrR family transcriptional regulator [Gemmataceae bacterium]
MGTPVLETRKAGLLLQRFIALAHWVRRRAAGDDVSRPGGGRGDHAGVHTVAQVTIDELAELWGCSRRAAQQSLRRLARWGLVAWKPQPGRGGRSILRVTVHPVYAYLDRAEIALRREQWAEAAFWLTEILRECPCIPQVPALLAEARARLGLSPRTGDWACCGDGEGSTAGGGSAAGGGTSRSHRPPAR